MPHSPVRPRRRRWIAAGALVGLALLVAVRYCLLREQEWPPHLYFRWGPPEARGYHPESQTMDTTLPFHLRPGDAGEPIGIEMHVGFKTGDAAPPENLAFDLRHPWADSPLLRFWGGLVGARYTSARYEFRRDGVGGVEEVGGVSWIRLDRR